MTVSTKLLKISRVAEILDLSTKTVRRLIGRQQLVAIQVGKQWRVDPRDLAAYLARGRSNVVNLSNDFPDIPE